MKNVIATWTAPSNVQAVFGPDSEHVLLVTGLGWFLWRFRTDRVPCTVEVPIEAPAEAQDAALGLLELDGASWVTTGSGPAFEWPPSPRSRRVQLPIRYESHPRHHRSSLLTQSSNIVVTVEPDGSGDRTTIWEPSAPPTLLRSRATVRCDTEAPCGVVALADGERFAVVNHGWDVVVLHAGTERTTAIEAKPDGHPWSAVAHPRRPLIAVFSGCVSLVDVDSGAVVDRLSWFNGQKSTGVFTRNGRLLLIVAGAGLWGYDIATRSCVWLAGLPVGAADSNQHAQLSPDGRVLLLIHDENEVTVIDVSDIDDKVNASPASGGRLASWLDGAEAGEAGVHARYGSASVVLEALYGPPVLDLKSEPQQEGAILAKATCPACSTKLTFDAQRKATKDGHVYAFGKGDRGWRRVAAMTFESKGDSLKPADGWSVAAEFDDIALSGFWLAEMFRGPAGHGRLARWFRSLGLFCDETLPWEVFSWPRFRSSDKKLADLGRPTLLVNTGAHVVVVVHHPPREGHEKFCRARLDACRRLVAERIGTSHESTVSYVVLVPDAMPEPEGDGLVVATWGKLLAALAHKESDPRVARRIERMSKAHVDQGSLDTLHLLAERDQRYDYDWPVLAYRSNVMTVSGPPSVIACNGCGTTWNFVDLGLVPAQPIRLEESPRARKTKPTNSAPDRREADENACLLDLLAELSADHQLAERVMRGLDTGPVQRVMCWPALRFPGEGRFTPDAVIVGERCVVVVEAKRPGGTKGAKIGKNIQGELLIRAAQAIWLREKLGVPGFRVLALGDEFSADIGCLVWDRFKALKCQVATWSKKGEQEMVLEATHPIAEQLKKTGQAGMQTAYKACGWKEFVEAVATGAEQDHGPASRGVALRAKGFLSYRRL